jgi:hypothetical protein
LPRLCYDLNMHPSRRLIFYLLLNIFVSACVTLSILYVYDRNQRAAAPALPAVQSEAASLEIAAVIGAGLLDSETLLVRNTGQDAVDLNGWQVRDADGNTYTFAPLSLPANAAIQLRTAPGKDSVVDLYWGLSATVWSSGETASLLDPAGNIRSVYQVP